MRIQQLSELTDILASAIRYYESVSLIKDVKRTKNGYRHYSAEHLEHLKLIKLAQSLGFSLDDISALMIKRDEKLTPEQHEQVLCTLDNKADAIDAAIESLQQQRDKVLALKNVLLATWDQGECVEFDQINQQLLNTPST